MTPDSRRQFCQLTGHQTFTPDAVPMFIEREAKGEGGLGPGAADDEQIEKSSEFEVGEGACMMDTDPRMRACLTRCSERAGECIM